LESRDAIGGTWDLFRYPGIRSDSDMFVVFHRVEVVRCLFGFDSERLLYFLHFNFLSVGSRRVIPPTGH
jgi:hypothetical protein